MGKARRAFWHEKGYMEINIKAENLVSELITPRELTTEDATDRIGYRADMQRPTGRRRA